MSSGKGGRSGKPDFRLFGRVRLAEAAGLAELAATLPEDAATLDGQALDIEYAGFWIDIEEFLDASARLLQIGDSGHLDVFDDEAGVILRYDLAPGKHTWVTHRYDDIMEHTKGEGNW